MAEKTEETFKISIEPSTEVRFAGSVQTTPTTVELKLKNTLDKKVAFKVKCTSNKMFKIRPAVGLLAPQQETAVSLTCAKLEELPGQGKHYFAAYHIDAPDDADNGRKVWTDRATGGRTDPPPKRLHVFFDTPTP